MSGNVSISDLWTTEASTWLWTSGHSSVPGFMAYMSGRDPRMLLDYLELNTEGVPQQVLDTLRAYVSVRS